MSLQKILYSALVVMLLCLSALQAQQTVFQASDHSFSVKLPGGFGPASSPPNNTILAAQMGNSGITLFSTKDEAISVGIDAFAEKMKQNLYDSGAQIHGKAKAPLAGMPAASFLVGGVVSGKESLFVFNQRDDAVYTFVLNYPVGERKKAATMWNAIAPTFQFQNAPAQ